MNKQLFKDLKQTLSENGYHHNGDKWGAIMGLWFEVAAMVYEESETPKEWRYRPGFCGNQIDTESYNYEWLNSLTETERMAIGCFLFRMSNVLDKAGVSY